MKLQYGGGYVWSMQKAEICLTKSVGLILVSVNRLDPDVGVDEDIAQFYFMQLVSAMVCPIYSL